MRRKPKDLERLLKLLNNDELYILYNTANPFGMDSKSRKQYELSVTMGHNEYGFASALASFYLLGKGLSGNVADNITDEGVGLYLDYLTTHTKQFILDRKPELIHKVI
jgi:hypothetical protein